MCSLLTNMLSCGFVFVNAGLIAASTVCINTRACSLCVSVCGSEQECKLLLVNGMCRDLWFGYGVLRNVS